MTDTIKSQKANRLIDEKSPYLLQHAYNPVDWYPWGEEAFKKAEEKNKPIFLSIGYSTCHWCHVMAHESFEDPDVAMLMNEAFINIKVDREERPDLDGIYMDVCHMMTGRGGWPLTILMTPDKKPFFAATYIPKENRMGQPGMLALIPRIREFWILNRSEALQISSKIVNALKESTKVPPGFELGGSLLDKTFEGLDSRFDDEEGGFGRAPKFPAPHNLLFLLRYQARRGNKKALAMVEKTLQAMRRGGVYDHVGWGFHRYSTDARWLLPHFEKMLYDQAMLAITYIEAYQATGKEEYKETAEEIFAYVSRDMTSPEGGFYSAEDADSEGEEGKFYVWEEDEISQVLDEKEADLARQVFNILKEGNFSEEATGRKTGANILHHKKPLALAAADLKLEEDELKNRLEVIRKKLWTSRKKRIHPYKDDKILTDWNGLMIAAFAKGAQVFDNQDYARAAEKAASFILKKMKTSQGRLLHRFRAGKAGIAAHVDDYVFLTWGLLELYEATFEVSYLKEALALNKDLITHFWDDTGGGFYFTGDYGEELIVRKKEIYDGAVPSGNSVAMLNLLRLARFTGQWSLEEKAVALGRAFSRSVSEAPIAYTGLMSALDFAEGPTFEIVLAGDLADSDTQSMLAELRRRYIPGRVLLFRPGGEAHPEIASVAPFTMEQKSSNGKPIAYVCSNHTCMAPIKEAQELRKFFEKGK